MGWLILSLPQQMEYPKRTGETDFAESKFGNQTAKYTGDLRL